MKHYLLLLVALLVSHGSLADDHIFAIQGDQVLTQSDMDAAFARIPEAHRLQFIRDGGRVDQLVQNLLRARQIAAAARAEGFDQDPLVRGRLELSREEELAKLWIEHILANAPEADYEAMAEEYFLANPDEFMSLETLDVSHILVSTETRSELFFLYYFFLTEPCSSSAPVTGVSFSGSITHLSLFPQAVYLFF